MKKFDVAIFEEQGGYISIEAENEKEAREKTEEILSNYGIEGFDDFRPTHRDTQIVEVEERETYEDRKIQQGELEATIRMDKNGKLIEEGGVER